MERIHSTMNINIWEVIDIQVDRRTSGQHKIEHGAWCLGS